MGEEILWSGAVCIGLGGFCFGLVVGEWREKKAQLTEKLRDKRKELLRYDFMRQTKNKSFYDHIRLDSGTSD
jgi:hypothetical protein